MLGIDSTIVSLSLMDFAVPQPFSVFPVLFFSESAPTSFEGNYGRIIYRVRAFITTPRFAKDYNTEKAFYLLRPLNLNELPDVWVRHYPVRYSQELCLAVLPFICLTAPKQNGTPVYRLYSTVMGKNSE